MIESYLQSNFHFLYDLPKLSFSFFLLSQKYSTVKKSRAQYLHIISLERNLFVQQLSKGKSKDMEGLLDPCQFRPVSQTLFLKFHTCFSKAFATLNGALITKTHAL